MENDAIHLSSWRFERFDKWERYVLDEIVIEKGIQTAFNAKLSCKFLLSMCSGKLEASILDAMNKNRYVCALQQIIKLRFRKGLC